MATTTKDFNGKCILYAKVDVKIAEENGSLVAKIMAEGTTWGEFKTCGYTMYTNIYVGIYAVVWCCLYLLVTKRDNVDKGWH
jgi:hypothetical protein